MSGAKKLLKKAYDLLPFKQPVYTVVRSMAKVPEPIYRHLHFRGVIKVPVSKKESFRITHFGQMIENELFWKGITGWEPISMELWIRLCRRSNVIMDIGANTGVYALVAHAVNPQAKIAAVEPVERIHRRLQENINLNDGSILAVHAAVSDHTGTAVLYDLPDSDHVLSVSLEQKWNQASTRLRPVEVPCITVKDLAQRMGCERIDLLKIDVETHEPAVLRGFKDILVRDRPSMLIEILNDQVAAEVTPLLDGLGYEYYNIDDVTWPPVKTGRLSRSGHYNFLVCMPEVAQAIGI
ncbi:MAG: FkbM family methyltransferase [Flavobacteriales bacterium]|nr:FkbM family methyltransferase [Flavobacteriales bacterium]MCL4283206.1 FkbM family methyltransferase [Flavobacteriales bacterium]